MTLTILDRDNTPRPFGAVFRRSRPGPERKLVEAFLEQFPFSIPRGCSTTVFCEPRIESGFPDLVIVFWNEAIAERWVPDRFRLIKDDIRLIHYLHQTGPLSSEALRARLSKSVIANLDRLEAAELVFRVGNAWKPRCLAKSFAARQIIAVEAKISEWARAARQAFQNTWFASDSFVLLPKDRPVAAVRSAAREFGIRFCSPGKCLRSKNMSASSLPRSYVSWLFNEWAWRSAQL